MFWNKKRKELERRIDVLNVEILFLRNITDSHRKRFDLILKELNKEYIPETEKKEPAKLVEKVDLSRITICRADESTFTGGSQPQPLTDDFFEKPKKKAGRTKKK